MMKRAHILAVAAILILATACNSAGADIADSPPDQGIAEGEPNPSEPSTGMCAPGVTDCVDVIMEPEAETPRVDYRPIAVEGDVPGEGTVIGGGELVRAEGNLVEVGFWMGVEDCFAVERVEVVETDTSVAIDVTVAPRDPSRACIEVAEARSVAIDLGAPIGERVLEIGGVTVAG